jgi:hypothetical protein
MTITLAISAALGACSPVVRGGPDLALPPSIAAKSRIDSIALSTNWLRTKEDFAATFVEEVAEELALCADGSYPLQLRVHVASMDRAKRLETLLNGDGVHQVTAMAELIDPSRRGMIVGRYPLSVTIDAGGAVAGLVSDREMMMSEGLGRAICQAVFARNPRQPGPTNATPR